MASNLRLIDQTTVSSSVSVVNVENVFSADFDVYQIVAHGFSTASTTATESFLRYINSNGSVVTADYDFACWYMKAEGSYSKINSSNTGESTKIHYAVGTPDQAPDVGNGLLNIFNPFNSSAYTYNTGQQSSYYSNPRYLSTIGVGRLKQTASITGFQFSFPSSNVSSGTIKTYGLRID